LWYENFLKYLLAILLKDETIATPVAITKAPIGYPIGEDTKID